MSPAPSVPVGVRAGLDGTVRVELPTLDGRVVVRARTASDRRRGALARKDGETLAQAARMALQLRVPLVLELASSGADVSEGVDALHGWGRAAAAVATCSGQVPVLVAVTGPVISGPALLLGLADLVVMANSAVAFVSGPSMVAEFTGVRVGLETLGGVGVHASASGLCALRAEDTGAGVAELLSFLPPHTDTEGPVVPTSDPPYREATQLRSVVPPRGTCPTTYETLPGRSSTTTCSANSGPNGRPKWSPLSAG